MAENAAELLENIKILLWGPSVKEDVFRRWAQGELLLFAQEENNFFLASLLHKMIHSLSVLLLHKFFFFIMLTSLLVLYTLRICIIRVL